MKRITSILLVLVMVLSSAAIVGCDLSTLIGGEGTTTTTTNKIEDNEPKDLIIRMTNRMKAAGYDEMKETAYFYFQSQGISSIYDYSVEIVDGKIYLHGYIFDDIIYVTNHDFVYAESILPYALSSDEEIYETLLKIQNHGECYILKPQEENGVGFQILVYEIEGEFYLLASYYTDEVLKIHKVTIE